REFGSVWGCDAPTGHATRRAVNMSGVFDQEQDAPETEAAIEQPEIPAKFGGDLGKLVESYAALERRLTELGTENSGLRQQVADSETAPTPPPDDPAVDWAYPAEYPQAGLDAHAHLQALAAAAAGYYDQAVGAAPQSPTQEEIHQQAGAMLTANIRDYG